MNPLPSAPPGAGQQPGLAAWPGRVSGNAGLGTRPLLAIITAFWIYVAFSNVLYANSMQASLSTLSPGHFFAPWDARLLQHLFLYPFLVVCVWVSLRLGWLRRWRSIPLQLLVALFFAALGAPALELGEYVSHDPQMFVSMNQSDHLHAMSHSFPALSDVFSDLTHTDWPMWLASMTSFFLTYGFCVALINGIAMYQRYRDSQLRSAALERALTDAHLAALRMQLSPHTLFNLLHTIRGQISWDPAAAQSMVVQLGDLLRRLLSAGEREFSRLTEELHFVRLYLELQQKRFADRLTVWISDVDDLPTLWVPSLILQPLVENAVVHGLARHTGPVEVRVEARTEDGVEDGLLVLRVVNTVARDSVVGRESIGLRNVRDRLALHFGPAASFFAAGAEDSQWIAEVRVPLLREGPETRSPVLREGVEPSRAADPGATATIPAGATRASTMPTAARPSESNAAGTVRA